jgi:hypothetical protein
MQADIRRLNRPGPPLPEFFGGHRLAAVQREADPAELGQRFRAQLREVAFGDGSRFVAAQAAEYLDAASVIWLPSRCVGQNDASRVPGEGRGVRQDHVTAEAAAQNHGLHQAERVAEPPEVAGPGPQVPRR